MAVIINKDGGGGGGSAVLGFILGAVMLVAGVIGFFMWDNYKSGGAPKAPDVIVVKQPAAPKVEKVVTEKTVITETRKEED